MRFYWTLICALGLWIYIHPLSAKNPDSLSVLLEKPSTELIIPFQLVKKLIILEAYIDGKKGNFILDTGAQSLILNKRHFSPHLNLHVQATDFTGARVKVAGRTVKFGWQTAEEKTCQALISPLEKIEKLLDLEIWGYIGYFHLKDFEVLFDYQHKQIILFHLDKKGRRRSNEAIPSSATDTLYLRKNGFLPYLTLKAGNKKLRLAIDSGASLSLLCCRLSTKIPQHFQSYGIQRTAGFDGRESSSQRGLLLDLHCGQKAISPLNCVLVDLKQLNSNLPTRIDGLLGYEFLEQHTLSINYRLNQLYLFSQ